MPEQPILSFVGACARVGGCYTSPEDAPDGPAHVRRLLGGSAGDDDGSPRKEEGATMSKTEERARALVAREVASKIVDLLAQGIVAGYGDAEFRRALGPLTPEHRKRVVAEIIKRVGVRRLVRDGQYAKAKREAWMHEALVRATRSRA